MGFSDDLAHARSVLETGDSKKALKLLEQLRAGAKKARNTSDLQAVLVVTKDAEAMLDGGARKEARFVVYGVEQNLRELGAVPGEPAPAEPDAREALAGAPQSSRTAPLLEVVGVNGTIRLDEDFLTISRKGFRARASVGKGEKRILLNQITAVQLKPAGPLVNGFIQFTLGGGNESRSRFGSQTFNAVEDENSVLFSKAKQPEFETFRDAVEQTIAARHRPQQAAPAAASIPDQIGQLASLRDAGILTEEEFQAKKQELLARL